MSNNHTPGPWFTTTIGAQVRTAAKRAIAYVASHEMNAAERAANACLIAAAPDLLAACERAVAAAKKPDDFIEGAAAYENLLAVIAKARGETTA